MRCPVSLRLSGVEVACPGSTVLDIMHQGNGTLLCPASAEAVSSALCFSSERGTYFAGHRGRFVALPATLERDLKGFQVRNEVCV